MKTLLMSLLVLLSINTSMANEEVLEVIFDNTHTTTLTVAEDSFIPNIMGYACPVPALNLERYQVWNRALNHRGGGDFGVKVFALRIKDPNMQFCHWPNATEVFGEDFKVGAKFTLSIRTVRELVKFTDHNGVESTFLRESISSSLNDKELFSQARVALSPRQ